MTNLVLTCYSSIIILTGPAVTSHSYTLLSSTNLITWQTNSIVITGKTHLEWVDTKVQCKFYRIIEK